MKNIEDFAGRVATHPWHTLIVTLFVILMAGWGGQRLFFNGDYRIFFGPDDPQLVAFEEMQRVYTKSDNIAIVIAPDDHNVFTSATLPLIWQLTQDAWQTPHSIRVDSITNYQHTEAIEDDLLVEDLLLELEQLNETKINKIRQVALAEPQLLRKLVAPNGDTAVINITIQVPDGDNNESLAAAANHVRDLVSNYQQQYPQVDFYLSGIVMMNMAFAEESENDAQTLVPAMFVGIILMLWFLLRSFWGTLATLIVIATSIAATMGLAGWLGIELSTTTVNVPTIVMTLAVADCVHILSTVLFDLHRHPDRARAVINSLEINFAPILLTSVTTAIGFLTLNFSYSPPLRDLGNLVAIGVMIAFALSLTLFPALLMLLPIKASNKPAATHHLQGYANWLLRRPKIIAGLSMLVVLGLSAQLGRNVVNDVAVEYFSPQTEFRQSTDYMAKHLAGMDLIEFSIHSGEDNGINHPDFLKLVERFSQWLRQQPETDHVSTLSDILMRLNKNMHGDDPAQYLLPANQELSAQYLLMFEMSLPYGLDLNNQLNVAKSATRVTATFKNLGSNELVALEQRCNEWFARHAPALEIKIASTSLMFAHIGERNMISMLRGSFMALVLICILVGLSLRSRRLCAISLVPIIAPAAIGFGIWGLYDGNINLALSIVTSVTLGIVVDDAVHFLSKYQRARLQGQVTEDAIRYAFSHVGKALWVTTLVLVFGFMLLTLSNFKMNADMGLLTAIIIALALVVDFVLLPVLLLLFDKSDTAKTANTAPTSDTATASTSPEERPVT